MLRQAFAGIRDADEAEDKARLLLVDTDWPGDLIAGPLARLAADQFFEPPLRAQREGHRTSARWFECPEASLSATVVSARSAPDTPSAKICIPGRLIVTRYIRCGGAHLLRWRGDRAGPEFHAASAPPIVPIEPLTLNDGAIVTHDGRCEAQSLTRGTSDVVMLSFTIRIGGCTFVRDYDRTNGRLVRVSSLDDHAGRSAMLLRFLRDSERSDAGGQFEAATRDVAFFLRWEAMREWLALDAEAAIARLNEMAAADPNTEVRTAASHMLDLVRERLETRCPV